VNLSDLDYELPPELIAQEPLRQRDRCRLLVLERSSGRVTHGTFHDLAGYLAPGDLLVLNDTRVIHARLHGVRRATQGKVEVLLVEKTAVGHWRMMCQARGKLQKGESLELGGGRILATLEARDDDGIWEARLEPDPDEALLREVGLVPLPPYINRDIDDKRFPSDAVDYQTVFARRPGAVASPTAGLHFTPAFLDRLRSGGIETKTLTLHVGLGTFLPIRTENLNEHQMHAESYEIPADTFDAVRQIRDTSGRVVAVGTTVTRALESAGQDGLLRGRTELFICPPFTFRTVDVLLTNFHLPRSTLLALVTAFAGRELVMNTYREAVAQRYRFYSYGDAMLIL